MDKIEFINSELKEEMEIQKQIKEKTADILDGLTERLSDADHLFFLYLIEFISALIIRMNGLNERINFLEEQNNV